MERVILGQPGKIGHVQWCLPLPLDTFPTEVAAALASYCCSSPIGLNHLIPSYTAKHRSLPALPSSLCLSPGISLPSAIQPLVYHPAGQQHPPTLPGSLLWAQSHHLGGTGCWSQQQATQKRCQGLFIGQGLQFLAYTITGFLHKKGEKKIFATLASYGLK